MGALGSGRRPFSNRRTTDNVCCIDVRRWVREGRLATTTRFNWRWDVNGQEIRRIIVYPSLAALFITPDAMGGVVNGYRIELTRTPCRFGGSRVWFVCPAVGCGRRAAILYGGATFACRHCHKLSYQSQRETTAGRAARRAEKLRDQFGWPGCILDGALWRPKGMHHKTFQRLAAKYEAAVGACLSDARRRFGEDFLGSNG